MNALRHWLSNFRLRRPKTVIIILSRAIRALVSKSDSQIFRASFKQLSTEVTDFMFQSSDESTLSSLVVAPSVTEKIKRVILEYVQRDKLQKHNLENRCHLLLYGSSGTGKTITAVVLANKLKLPLYVLSLGKVVSKFIGETGLKLSKVLEYISQLPGIFYLFEEFEAIGSPGGSGNAMGELSCVQSTFLQLLELEGSNSIIIATTNDIAAFDKALLRRFDDVIQFQLPGEKEIFQLIENTFVDYSLSGDIHSLTEKMMGMSCADIVKICMDVIKSHILEGMSLDTYNIESMIDSKSHLYL